MLCVNIAGCVSKMLKAKFCLVKPAFVYAKKTSKVKMCKIKVLFLKYNLPIIRFKILNDLSKSLSVNSIWIEFGCLGTVNIGELTEMHDELVARSPSNSNEFKHY